MDDIDDGKLGFELFRHVNASPPVNKWHAVAYGALFEEDAFDVTPDYGADERGSHVLGTQDWLRSLSVCNRTGATKQFTIKTFDGDAFTTELSSQRAQVDDGECHNVAFSGTSANAARMSPG